MARASLLETKTPVFLRDVCINADILDALKHIPGKSIHLTFTSPPYYNARAYSYYPTYEAYLDFLEEVLRQVHRLTTEGRFLVVNTSPVIEPRKKRSEKSMRYPIPFDLHHRIQKNGWEFIDDIIWVKPEPSVKNRNACFARHRKPLAYKPNSVTEYLFVYRKKTNKLIDWNIRNYSQETTQKSLVKDEYETSNLWYISPASDRVHPAVFPKELCKRIIEFYSYKNDLIFDPFAGSGILAETATETGRYFLAVERDKGFFEYMKTKLKRQESLISKKAKFLNLEEFIKNTLRLY